MNLWQPTPEEWALIAKAGSYLKWIGSGLSAIALTGNQLINIYKFLKGKRDENNSGNRDKKHINNAGTAYDNNGRRIASKRGR